MEVLYETISRESDRRCGLVAVLLLAPVGAEQSEDIVLGSHYGFSGVITKIESGMLFIRADVEFAAKGDQPE